MDNFVAGFIPLGELFKIYYMDPEVVDKYRDVFITSNTGKGYGINRSILAALSPFCRDLFLDLYKCPLANADDSIHISTNLTDEELDIIKDFFESGGKLPSTQDGKVAQDASPVFAAVGLNLVRMSPENGGMTNGGVKIKQELEDNKYDVIHQQQSSDAMMLIASVGGPAAGVTSGLADGNDMDDFAYFLPQVDINEEDFWDSGGGGGGDSKAGIKKGRGRGRPKGSGSGVRGRPKKIKIEAADEDDGYEDYEGSGPPAKKKKPANSATNGDTAAAAAATTTQKGKAGFFHFPDSSQQPRDLSKEFQCERCARGFTTLFSYRMHFHRHDMPEPDYEKAFICIRCMSFTASSSEAITKHQKEECPVKRFDDLGSKFTYYCIKCEPGQRFDSAALLNKHLIEKHGKNELADTSGNELGDDASKNYPCEVCGKAFKKVGQLNQHMKTHDENRKKDTRTRICYTCGKEVLAIYYSKHMRYKHGGANVKCTMCDAVFAHEVKLKAHMKNVHTYVTCDQCGVSVKSYALKPHIIVHHTADTSKPFVCQDCGKGFSTKQKYQDHRNIHTGEKPHLCKYCPRTFGDTSNRNKHIREAHHEQYMLNKLKKAAKQKEESV